MFPFGILDFSGFEPEAEKGLRTLTGYSAGLGKGEAPVSLESGREPGAKETALRLPDPDRGGADGRGTLGETVSLSGCPSAPGAGL